MTGGGPRRKDRHEAEDIGAILGRWLASRPVRQRRKPDSIFTRWKEIVGEEIASSTRVVKLTGGVLTVEVDSAPLLNELAAFHRQELLESIRARPEFGGIQEIRFRAGAK